MMNIFTLDLEGVLIPEIWVAVAEKTGIPELRRTTRDEPDYDKLMHYRMDILSKHNITLSDIQNVISTLDPLEGAKEFYGWLKSIAPVIILSDTFCQFANPIMKKLDYPTLFCHELLVDEKNMISGYKLRMQDQKKHSVEALKKINFNVIAAGDSYNDLSMLRAADSAVLFRPTEKFASDNSDLPVAYDYASLKKEFEKFIK